MSYKLLIADDDGKLLKNCIDVFLAGIDDLMIEKVETIVECVGAIAQTKYDLLLLDVSFTSKNKEGVGLIPEIKKISPDTEIVMMTSFDDSATISQCMQLGASDFISKNIEAFDEKLALRVEGAIARRKKRSVNQKKGKDIALENEAVFSSKAMRDVFGLIADIRLNPQIHVLITGPTGSGKELVARSVCRRLDGAPYQVINSACLPEKLIESELFGHEKGAFTGADKLKKGKFEEADGGDIFLDEVATLSLEAQAKLLRVLQYGEFSRVGGNAILKTSARVIAATNEDLEQMVDDGLFRFDLLRRLRKFHLEIPPLNERKEDIEPIISAILAKSAKPNAVIAEDCLQMLRRYSWPGNVGQLEDTVIAMVMLAHSDELTIGDVPKKFFDAVADEEDECFDDHASGLDFRFSVRYGTVLDDAEKAFFAEFIKATASRLRKPNITKVAKALGVPRSSLGKRMARMDVAIAEFEQ